MGYSSVLIQPLGGEGVWPNPDLVLPAVEGKRSWPSFHPAVQGEEAWPNSNPCRRLGNLGTGEVGIHIVPLLPSFPICGESCRPDAMAL